MYVRHFKPLSISRNPPISSDFVNIYFSAHPSTLPPSILQFVLHASTTLFLRCDPISKGFWKFEGMNIYIRSRRKMAEGRVFFFAVNLKLNSRGIGVNGGVNSRPLMVLLSHHRGGKGEVLGWGKNIISIFCPRISSLGNILVSQVVVKEDDQKKWTILGSRVPWFFAMHEMVLILTLQIIFRSLIIPWRWKY